MATHDGGMLPPMTPPRPVSERPQIDWDTPVGRAHAHNLVAILAAHAHNLVAILAAHDRARA